MYQQNEAVWMGRVVGSYLSFWGDCWENLDSLGGKGGPRRIGFQVGVQQWDSDIQEKNVVLWGLIHAEHQNKWVKHVQGLVVE